MEEQGDMARMEVWCGFVGRWVDGFELVEVFPSRGAGGERYVVRRSSDRAVLPTRFPETEVRAVASSDPWPVI